jgi:PTS system fructose-specific IIC component/PTS system nitrogen regulatory IIA component
MMLAPVKDETEKHLGLLKRLAELLENPEFFTELLAQTGPQAAYEIIKKHEDILIALD